MNRSESSGSPLSCGKDGCARSIASPSAASERSSRGRPQAIWSSAKASKPRWRQPHASPIAAAPCSRLGPWSQAGVSADSPTIPGVARLIILVDHDGNGKGQAAAERCRERWTRAGRTVIRLTPKRVDADFNDLVMPQSVS